MSHFYPEMDQKPQAHEIITATHGRVGVYMKWAAENDAKVQNLLNSLKVKVKYLNYYTSAINGSARVSATVTPKAWAKVEKSGLGTVEALLD